MTSSPRGVVRRVAAPPAAGGVSPARTVSSRVERAAVGGDMEKSSSLQSSVRVWHTKCKRGNIRCLFIAMFAVPTSTKRADISDLLLYQRSRGVIVHTSSGNTLRVARSECRDQARTPQKRRIHPVRHAPETSMYGRMSLTNFLRSKSPDVMRAMPCAGRRALVMNTYIWYQRLQNTGHKSIRRQAEEGTWVRGCLI